MAFMHEQGGLPIPGIVHIPQPYWYGEGGDLVAGRVRPARRRGSWRRRSSSSAPDRVAAFIGEPIQGAGGVIIPPDTYWPEIQRICDRYGILLVADEVICGFGRTGHWFGCDLYGIRPDLMTLAKGLSSGYLPIGGVMVGRPRRRRADRQGRRVRPRLHLLGPPGRLRRGERQPARSSSRRTWSCARRDELGPYLAAKWRQLAEHPLVGEARSVGLIGALELVRDKATRRFFDKRGEVGHDLPRLLLPERPDHARRARHHDHLAAAGDQPRAGRRAGREGLALPRPDARAAAGRTAGCDLAAARRAL